MVYNDTVQTYNAAIEQLPASLVAGALGFRRRALFELADGRAMRRLAWLALALVAALAAPGRRTRRQELHGPARRRHGHARAHAARCSCART